MRAWLLFLCLLAPPAAAQITVPAETQPYAPIVASCAVPEAGESQTIWECSSGCQFLSHDATTIHVWAPPGSHTLTAFVATIDFESKKFSFTRHVAAFVVSGTPPTPPPVPPQPPNPPPPGPLPPGPGNLAAAVLLHESEDDTAAFSRLAVALRNPNGDVQKWLKTTRRKLLILDDDSVDETGAPTKIVQHAKAAGVSMPSIVLIDESNAVRGSLAIDQDDSDGSSTKASQVLEWMKSHAN